MHSPRVLLATVLMLAGAMPVSAQTILQSTDKFTGQVHYSTNLREPKLEGGSFISMRYVHVGLHAFKPVVSVGRPYDVCFDA